MSYRPVIALGAAEIASLLGTRLSMIAIPWLVLTTTGDPLTTGFIGFAEMLPYVLAKALAGPLIDKLGTRRIAIAADAASMAAVILVPILHFSGALHIATLLPVVVLLGALRGPADAAKQSMVPAIASMAGVALERVTGVMGTVDRMAGTLGAALGGLVIAAIGPAPALIVTALACGLAAAITAAFLHPPHVPAQTAGPGYFTELAEGWTYLRTSTILINIVMMIAITNLFDQAYVTVLLPVWANATGDAALLGALLATFSAAAIAGAALATLLGPKLPRLLVYSLAFLICGAPRYLVFVIDAPLAAIFVTLATAGFASGFINPIISAVMFERIPPALVGRVNSLIGAIAWMLIPFGGLVGGALVTAFGLETAFALCGIGYLAVTMLPLALPGFRAMAQRPA